MRKVAWRLGAAAADELCGPDGTDPLMTRLPLLGTKIRVAGYGGLRLGEQNALRAIDCPPPSHPNLQRHPDAGVRHRDR